jgi:hypothetical protein
MTPRGRHPEWGGVTPARLRRIFYASLALTLAACADPVVGLKPLTVAAARAAAVGMITIVNQSADATTEDLAALQTQLLNRSSRCATGPNRYDMIVQVQNFRHGDWRLVSVPYTVQARVVLVDPVLNTVAATYYVEADRASRFADRICRDVFDSVN